MLDGLLDNCIKKIIDWTLSYVMCRNSCVNYEVYMLLKQEINMDTGFLSRAAHALCLDKT